MTFRPPNDHPKSLNDLRLLKLGVCVYILKISSVYKGDNESYLRDRFYITAHLRRPLGGKIGPIASPNYSFSLSFIFYAP